MKKRQVVYLLIAIIVFILSLFLLDKDISKFFSDIRGETLNAFFMIFAYAGTILMFIFLTSLFLWRDHKRKWILPLWIAMVIASLTAFILKFIVQRQRPYQLGVVSTLPILEKVSHLAWDFSFPSSHAIIAFSAIPVLSKEFPRFKYAWIIFASLVALSRVYFGLHFMSDVIAGAVMGYLIGFFIVKIEDKNKFWERLYKSIFWKR
ncbi:MAG TPA: phosphatase PAP2 family protein [Candidatus Nanoarchaeia archaeon]|nr:phosphatase PAP2 family protein [Candidatus Nanoarchaeia archaeon]